MQTPHKEFIKTITTNDGIKSKVYLIQEIPGTAKGNQDIMLLGPRNMATL